MMNATGDVAGWLHRWDIEQQLVRLCDEFDHLLEVAYAGHHPDAAQSHHPQRLRWARTVRLISLEESETWRHALIVRNAILAQDFQVVLDDIEYQRERLKPVVDVLLERINALPPDTSNVIRFR